MRQHFKGELMEIFIYRKSIYIYNNIVYASNDNDFNSDYMSG